MITTTPKPIIHIFKECKRYKTTRHYKLETVSNGTNQLTDIINISKDRNFAKSTPDYWVQIRENGKWKKPRLTGLFKTDSNIIFKGDTEEKNNLILCKFSDNSETLTIYFYSNYFTRYTTAIIKTIQ